MLANNRPRNQPFWQRFQHNALAFIAGFSVFKLATSAFKFLTGWLIVSQGNQPIPLNTVSRFECSENADLFFRARALGTFNHFANYGCNPIDDNLAEISRFGGLTGITDYQEIKSNRGEEGKFQTIKTDVNFAQEKPTLTQYKVTGPIEKFISDKQPDPDATYVFSGVKNENDEFCRAQYKIKCG